MDDDDEKILPGEQQQQHPGDAESSPAGRRPSDSPSPMDEVGMAGAGGSGGAGGAGGDDAPVTSASQERLNISPNESRNSQKSPFCASSSSTGGASTPSDAGSVGRPGSGSGGETIVIGSSASSSQSSASTTPTASTPGTLYFRCNGSQNNREVSFYSQQHNMSMESSW